MKNVFLLLALLFVGFAATAQAVIRIPDLPLNNSPQDSDRLLLWKYATDSTKSMQMTGLKSYYTNAIGPAVWDSSKGRVYLKDTTQKVGIGTTHPTSNLTLQSLYQDSSIYQQYDSQPIINDAVFSGAIIYPFAPQNINFTVTITQADTIDKFSWQETGGSNASDSNIIINGFLQTLADGISIRFDTASGHTIGDQWYYYISPVYSGLLLAKDHNGNVSLYVNGNGAVGIGTDEPGSADDLYITGSKGINMNFNPLGNQQFILNGDGETGAWSIAILDTTDGTLTRQNSLTVNNGALNRLSSIEDSSGFSSSVNEIMYPGYYNLSMTQHGYFSIITADTTHVQIGGAGGGFWAPVQLQGDSFMFLSDNTAHQILYVPEDIKKFKIYSPTGDTIIYNLPVTIQDGTQSSGYVLTSDANGNASWQPQTGGGGGGGGTGWSLTGNTATSTASNFIGTTDNNSLAFATNDTVRLIIDSTGITHVLGNILDEQWSGNIYSRNAHSSTWVGTSTNAVNNTAYYTTAVGAYAADSSTSSLSTDIGFMAGESNTGNGVTAIGFSAALRNSGNILTAIGQGTGAGNTGFNSTFVGGGAGVGNTGNYVSGLGKNAGYGNTTSNALFINLSSDLGDTINSIIYSDNSKVKLNGHLQVNDGTQSTGYVLTSDSTGLATWQPPLNSSSVSIWDSSGGKVYLKDTTQKIGLGTTNPSSYLTIKSRFIDSSVYQQSNYVTSIDDAVYTGFVIYPTLPAAPISFTVTISDTGIPDKFDYVEVGGSNASDSGISIDGSNQLLADGISIQFSSLSGHAIGDQWYYNITPLFSPLFDLQDKNGSSKLFVSGDGNVGIGTNTPIMQFQINACPNPIVAFYKSHNIPGLSGDMGIGEYYGGLGWNMFDSISGSQVGFSASTYGFSYSLSNGVSGWRMDFLPDNISISQNGVDLFKVDTSGNVGIGTSDPSSNLTIRSKYLGSARYEQIDSIAILNDATFYGPVTYTTPPMPLCFTVTITDTAGGDKFMWFESGGNYYEQYNVLIDGTVQTLADGISIQFDSTTGHNIGDVWLYKVVPLMSSPLDVRSVYGSSYFSIDSTGNVGIGIDTPSAKLDIKGNLKLADGTQQANAILTSDSDGNAHWQMYMDTLHSFSYGTADTIVHVHLNYTDIQSLATSPVSIGLPHAGTGYYYQVLGFDCKIGSYGGNAYNSLNGLYVVDSTFSGNPSVDFQYYNILPYGSYSNVFRSGRPFNADGDMYNSLGDGGNLVENGILLIASTSDSYDGNTDVDCYITVRKIHL